MENYSIFSTGTAISLAAGKPRTEETGTMLHELSNYNVTRILQNKFKECHGISNCDLCLLNSL